MSRHPIIKWAQRYDEVYIAIELPNVKNVKHILQPEGRFEFYATIGPKNIEYKIDLELFGMVNVKESKSTVGTRITRYLIKKAEKKWWSRLLKKEGKAPVYLKIDWDKWIDEDDEENKCKEDESGDGLEDLDFSKLNVGDADHAELDHALTDVDDYVFVEAGGAKDEDKSDEYVMI